MTLPEAIEVVTPDGPTSSRVFHVEARLPQLPFVKHNNNLGCVETDNSTPQALSHFSYEWSRQHCLVADVQGMSVATAADHAAMAPALALGSPPAEPAGNPAAEPPTPTADANPRPAFGPWQQPLVSPDAAVSAYDVYTDPAVHTAGADHRCHPEMLACINGSETDLSVLGFAEFFRSHQCSRLCTEALALEVGAGGRREVESSLPRADAAACPAPAASAAASPSSVSGDSSDTASNSASDSDDEPGHRIPAPLPVRRPTAASIAA